MTNKETSLRNPRLDLHTFVDTAAFGAEVPTNPSLSQRWDLMVEWLGVDKNKAKMEQILQDYWPEGVDLSDPELKAFSSIKHPGRKENPIVVAAIREIIQGKKWADMVKSYPHLQLENIFPNGEHHRETKLQLDGIATPIESELILEGFLMTPIYIRSTFDAKLELAFNRSFGYTEAIHYEHALEKAFVEGDVRVANRILELFPEMIVPSTVAELVRIEMSNENGESKNQISEETREKLASLKLEYRNLDKPEDQAKYYSAKMNIVKGYLMAGMSSEADEIFMESKFPTVEAGDEMGNVKYLEIMSLVKSVTILQDFPDYAAKIKASLMQNIKDFASYYESNRAGNPVINHTLDIFLGILEAGHKDLYIEMLNEIPESLKTTPFWIGTQNRVIHQAIPKTKDRSAKLAYFEWVENKGFEPMITNHAFSFQKEIWDQWNTNGRWDVILSEYGYTSDMLLRTSYEEIVQSNEDSGKLAEMLTKMGINNDHDLKLLKLDYAPVELYFEAKETILHQD